MASFLTDIWASVFEPGTNRSLVIATHASFAALQIVLFLLLLGTKSYHFVFLSIICAGVWGGIVWFVREIEALKRTEAMQAEQQEMAVKETDVEEEIRKGQNELRKRVEREMEE